MKGYTSHDVARMLDLSIGQVRAYTRAGFINPRRGPHGGYRFSFQDLVLLRTTKDLIASRIPPRKIKHALKKLKEQLPSGRPLSAVKIAVSGDRIVVRDGKTLWNPESGQTCFDFEVSELAEKAAPLDRRAAQEAFSSESPRTAEEWFDIGCELEATEPEAAREAYCRVLEIEPTHADVHINMGRLLHEAGQAGDAEAHYRVALALRPEDATALFNLGVSLEDLGRVDEAIQAYKGAAESDPPCADAYYNLARLYEKQGNITRALQHFNAYRRLTPH